MGIPEPEPDLAVLRGTEQEFWHRHPSTAELVVEVCITSHDYDRSKLRAYASAAVKECWLVLGPEKVIEVYRLPKDGEYSEQMSYGPGDTLVCAVLPGFTLALDGFFAK